MKSIVKEPLLHFLVLAIGLFALHSAVSHDDENTDHKRIVVDQNNLLNFVQYRTRSFEPVTAQKQLDSLSDESLKKVIDDYVREEALYREARSLGLDRDDYVIKRRLIQKIDYIARGFAESIEKVTDEDIRNYYEANKNDYHVEPRITFTHVFLNADAHGEAGAKALAERKLAEINQLRVAFNDASKHGERFLYGMNYVERSELLVESHFGAAMSQELFALEPQPGRWRGPFMSPHGAHLVMVMHKQEGYTPLLAEVRTRVAQDAQRDLTQKRTREATKRIVDSYDIDVVYERPSKDSKDLALLDRTVPR